MDAVRHQETACLTSSDLAAVIEAWDRLLEAIRAGIAAMVKAASVSGNLDEGAFKP
jgi:hypothetical protein